MKHFQAKLVAGKKSPYTSWTFLVVPAEIAGEWKASRFEVRGMIGGKPFRGTVSKGEGVHRMPLKKELMAELGVERGAVVDVAMELDPEPRPIELPKELRAVLRSDPGLAKLFEALPPSLRRAWSSYIGDAKRQETRERRARLAPERIRLREFPGS